MGVTGLDIILMIPEQHAEVPGGLYKTWEKINANYDPVAEAESILAQDALNVSAMAGTGSLVSALAY